MNFGGLPNGKYWLCVRLFSGAANSYTVDFQANFLQLYHYSPPPDATPRPTSDVPDATFAPSGPTVAATSAPPAPTVSPEVVATPGPNGPLESQELVALKGSQQAVAKKEGRSAVSIGLGIATILIAGSAAAFVFLRIRQDTA
jgi:hypothetical protein